MTLKLDNLGKPSNKQWKRIADFFLFSLPLYLSAIMALPLKEELKLWLNFGITMLTITFKAVSKFTSEEDPA
jgi:hypothetical protein